MNKFYYKQYIIQFKYICILFSCKTQFFRCMTVFMFTEYFLFKILKKLYGIEELRDIEPLFRLPSSVWADILTKSRSTPHFPLPHRPCPTAQMQVYQCLCTGAILMLGGEGAVIQET